MFCGDCGDLQFVLFCLFGCLWLVGGLCFVGLACWVLL